LTLAKKTKCTQCNF